MILAGDLNCNSLKSSEHKDLDDSIKVNGMFLLVLSTKSGQTTRTPGLWETVNPDYVFSFSEVCPIDVTTILKSLNSSKGSGHDNILPRMVKGGAEELAAPICYLANLSLQSSPFPTSEKITKITPVFESNDRSLLDDYSVMNLFM